MRPTGCDSEFPPISLFTRDLFSRTDSKFANTSVVKQVAIENLRVAKTQHSLTPDVDASPRIPEAHFGSERDIVRGLTLFHANSY